MNEIDDTKSELGPAQWGVIAMAVAASLGALVYRLLMHHRMGHSAALFIGLPAVLAILLALTPKAQSVTGGIVKGITFFLLIVAPLLGEGVICILMAAPLFYLVGIVIGLIVDKQGRRRKATVGCVVVIVLPMCLEGVIPSFTVNRAQTVEVNRVVNASADAVSKSLARSPRIDTPLPFLFSRGFPRPLEAHGSGLSVGALRTIHFSAAEGHPPGDLVMRVTEQGPRRVRFEAVSDSTKLGQWLRWDSSEVEWSSIDPSHTRVCWSIHFERQLDPAWYFVPWERAAVYEAAKYLIADNATPTRGAK